MTQPTVPKTADVPILRFDDLGALDGYLWRREGALLARLASLVPGDQAIVELGSFKGKSACYLARGSKVGDGARVHAVDLWDLGGQGEYVHLGFDLAETFETFERQVAAAKVKTMVTAHKGASTDVAATWSGPPIGLLFIDGDHRYHAVKADLEAWLPHCAPGAWVAFHDYSRQFPGVVEFVDEWLPASGVTDVTRYCRIVAARLPIAEDTES